jgi:hypothetical protein
MIRIRCLIFLPLQSSIGLARKVKIFSRKGAKAQSAAAFLKVFFAPLRLCAFAGEIFSVERTFRAKSKGKKIGPIG